MIIKIYIILVNKFQQGAKVEVIRFFQVLQTVVFESQQTRFYLQVISLPYVLETTSLNLFSVICYCYCDYLLIFFI